MSEKVTKRIYIYPKLDTSKLKSPNPYIDNFETALSTEYTIANKSPNSIGVLDMLQHLSKTDIYFINWIEYLPKQKLGKIQTLVFIFFVFLSKFLGKKIIWVLHNKYSHNKLAHRDGASGLKKFLFKFMIKQSHLIITHSISGIDFVDENFPRHAKKVRYIVHPVTKTYPVETTKKDIDLLIWGTIHPYKGIIDFLRYASDSGHLKETKINILGICPDLELKNKLNSYLSENVIHYDNFFDFEEIASYANRSKFVLFTYNSDSVLSSGSLMDSIGMGTRIIGPNKGAFKDLSDNSFVDTFDNYEEIFNFLKNDSNSTDTDLNQITEFCKANSWDNLISKIDSDINSLF